MFEAGSEFVYVSEVLMRRAGKAADGSLSKYEAKLKVEFVEVAWVLDGHG